MKTASKNGPLRCEHEDSILFGDKYTVGRTSRNLERGTVARFDVNGVDSGDAVCTLPTQLTRVS